MANIHQEQSSIRNMQVVSSNHVHSTQSCESNKCRIFKPFLGAKTPLQIATVSKSTKNLVTDWYKLCIVLQNEE